ncbi:MAG: Crp/Fnr family transcriptional regulator [Spirochaetia bacterium]|nr:Crp/Fnr family transcriptional regulator [Spirochaetia bacterium]
MLEHIKTYLESRVPLTDHEWNMLEGRLQLIKFHEKQIIYTPEDIFDKMFFLNKGIVRAYFIDPEGKEFTWSIHYNEPDAMVVNRFIVDYASFIKKEPSSFFFEAVTDSEAIVITDQLLKDLYSKSILWQQVGRVLSEEAYYLTHHRALSLLTKSAGERYQELIQKFPRLFEILPQQYLASYLGITPQSLSRLKKNFQN